MLNEDMRGLFFVIKGQYRKGVAPAFVNKVTGDTSYVGGYDPDREDTEQWFMCVDKMTFQCVACGSDLDKVLHGVYTSIVRYKDLKHYLKHISQVTSDDTYEVKYLGHAPLNDSQRSKKAEGRCPRTSPAMRCLYQEIYDTYGDYYSEEIEVLEDKAYEYLESHTSKAKAKKMRSNFKKRSLGNTTPEPQQDTTSTTKKRLTPKKTLKKRSL